MNSSLHVYGGSDGVLDALHGRTVFVVVAGLTLTSTIPSISVAGPSPLATLYTSTLDVEYLVAGRPRTLDVIPVAPNGVPTPAVITRSIVEAFRLPVVVVDTGCFYSLLIASYRLPSAAMGSRINLAPALDQVPQRGCFKRLLNQG